VLSFSHTFQPRYDGTTTTWPSTPASKYMAAGDMAANGMMAKNEVAGITAIYMVPD
jgi:hypothetical protein